MYGIRIENSDGTPRAAGHATLVGFCTNGDWNVLDIFVGTFAEATAKAAEMQACADDTFPLERRHRTHPRYVVTPLPCVGAMPVPDYSDVSDHALAVIVADVYRYHPIDDDCTLHPALVERRRRSDAAEAAFDAMIARIGGAPDYHVRDADGFSGHAHDLLCDQFFHHDYACHGDFAAAEKRALDCLASMQRVDVSRETAAADVLWTEKCADVAAAFAPTLHTLFGNDRDVHISAEYVERNEHVIIFHGIVTPLTPLTCDDVARFAGGMEMLCENEALPREADVEREIAGHTFTIGDGDDTAAAWMRGGVVYVWIRHFFE